VPAFQASQHSTIIILTPLVSLLLLSQTLKIKVADLFKGLED
jgi:hypothetical protein